jgi:hypothetical protein
VVAVTCNACSTEWAAAVRPCCPSCLVNGWLSRSDLVTGKHDPRNMGAVQGGYRSVLRDVVVRDLRGFLHAAVESGTWYYHTEHEAYNHVTHMPLDQKPGFAVGAGQDRTSRHLEDLVIADADRAPHVFADGRDATRRKLVTGVYRPLETCARRGCDNLAQPRGRTCAIHADPPLARPRRP